MSKKNVEEVVETVEELDYDQNTEYAQLVKEDDGFHVIDADGTKSDVLKVVLDGTREVICLTPNRSNRKYFAVKRAEAAIAENGYCPLTGKASKHFGPQGARVPNAKLVAYLSEEDQATFNAIIERAKAAMDADRKKPKTEAEKLDEKIAKLTAKIAELKAALAATDAE